MIELPKVDSAPTRAERRAWARKKANDRAVAAYRNSLPTSIVKLNALLTEAPSPWHAEVISRRIDTVREANRRHNRVRRARGAEASHARD
ncbi:hypothetical protein [Curtobacterium sp. 'Ferrero']|uniref:hypothetical protein n=1 Tax=Curtobacterium sp. 'Ferrero' TaxID=2033654 RepID=UPI001143EF7F|nr:hypothetical protein [Curtobacterium sp. 'Ferrero']